MKDMIQIGEKTIMHTYGRLPIVITKGEGCYLYDDQGNRYLDFVAGIAVNSLGYSNDALKEALKQQIDQFLHCSNLYYNQPNILAAEKLVEVSGMDRVFFCNSGAEAVEAAFKLSRKYAKKYFNEDKVNVIAMKNSFHGRTMGAISLTGQLKYQKGLSPLVPGISHGEYNQLDSIEALINENTCAVILEVIQGEGGILPIDLGFLQGVRALCDKYNALLIMDEVQTGVGRLGHWFGYQYFGVKPDIIATAKGLGGGFPVGAMLATEKAASGFEPGDHASTFGGNGLASTAIYTVIEEMERLNINSHVQNIHNLLVSGLLDIQKGNPSIKEIRGIGLMLGIELIESVSVAQFIQLALLKGLLIVRAGENTFRLVPPLVITEVEVNKALDIIKECLAAL